MIIVCEITHPPIASHWPKPSRRSKRPRCPPSTPSVDRGSLDTAGFQPARDGSVSIASVFTWTPQCFWKLRVTHANLFELVLRVPEVLLISFFASNDWGCSTASIRFAHPRISLPRPFSSPSSDHNETGSAPSRPAHPARTSLAPPSLEIAPRPTPLAIRTDVVKRYFRSSISAACRSIK